MRDPSPKRKAPARHSASSRIAVKRIDGARHWRKSLDRLVWFLLRAGVDHTEIVRALRTSLRNHQGTRPLAVPDPEVLEYSRILTHWQTEPAFLDEHGKARSLPLSGGSVSFKSLARQALPHADAADILNVLSRYRLLSCSRDGRVRMLASAFLPRGARRAQFLAYTLSALEGIIDTCYANLTSHEPSKNIGHMQRAVFAERFDLKHLAEYDAFLRDSAAAFLTKHDAWLKRREVKQPGPARRRIGYVGVGIFGFRAR